MQGKCKSLPYCTISPAPVFYNKFELVTLNENFTSVEAIQFHLFVGNEPSDAISPTSSSKDDLFAMVQKGVRVTIRVRLKLLILILTPTYGKETNLLFSSTFYNDLKNTLIQTILYISQIFEN